MKVKKWLPMLCILAVLAVCGVWIILQHRPAVSGNLAEVRISDQTVLRLPLNQDCRHELTGSGGIHLVVAVHDGSVYVERSECPDKICVHRGRISQEGDRIICMPARTVIEIIS